MLTVDFNASGACRAYIERGAVREAGRIARGCFRGGKLAVVTEAGIPKEHYYACAQAFAESGFEVFPVVLKGGERNKTLDAVNEIYEALYSAGLTRADAVAGLGGGVTLDIAGFAAATYLRGLPFISLPTTVIAQTDSAYGGKTGVDLHEGKNYIGCFRQPKTIVCDTAFLETLPERERICGMGEIIKYGAIAAPELVKNASRKLPSDVTVAVCAGIKSRFVEADEFDTGDRRILNFGHTFGHAIEAASDYAIPHGQAVAYGMLAMIRTGERLGITEAGVYDEIEDACLRAGLDTEYEPLMESALPLLKRDKKSDGDTIDAVLIKRLGVPVRMKLNIDELK